MPPQLSPRKKWKIISRQVLDFPTKSP
jgi:hypothetical protein